MTQRERVEIIRAHYPGYDAPLDSKVNRPQIYGITLTAGARQLLQGAKKQKSPVYKLTIRLDRQRETELRLALKGKEPADWVREMIDRKIKKSAQLRQQTGQNGCGTTAIVADISAAVKEAQQ